MDKLSQEIIKVNEDGSVTLEEDILNTILKNDEIKDMLISVISITGEFRKGKSFLLNFLIRYLQHVCYKKYDVIDWLDPELGPLDGFSFAPGAKRHTTGIHMWPELFCIELPSAEKVAILLLDTQGSFDNQSTVNDCAKIFALSTLISSLQILNLPGYIKQYNLSHLQTFSGYGSLLSDSKTSPFQKLVFLVRDWRWPDDQPYGFEGGNSYLMETFSGPNEELKSLVSDIKGNFEDIISFLMPYPGTIVERPEFKKTVSEIDEIFLKHMRNFVETILAPRHIVLKTINGEPITAGQLLFYLKGYCDMLKNRDLPTVQTLFQTTAETQHKIACTEALQLYKRQMDYECKDSLRCYFIHEIYNLHSLKKVAAVKKYCSLKKLYDEQIYDRYLREIKKNVDEEFNVYNRVNEEKVVKYKEQEEKRRDKEKTDKPSQEQKPGKLKGFFQNYVFGQN